MKRILITGGPVHGKLDSVKMITNKFKGGLMASIAERLYYDHVYDNCVDCEITYLTAKGSKEPFILKHNSDADNGENGINVIYHDGFYDYMDKVLKLAPQMDAVILGGAVANLIPKTPFEGKFPSHNYKPGDEINIPFIIAPRVVDQVKKVAPNTHLFAFKLLSNVEHETLIDAAYDIVLDSKATCVFANDTNDLMTKYAVTKERGVHPLKFNPEIEEQDELTQFIWDMINDDYYKTEHTTCVITPPEKFTQYAEMFKDKFQKRYGKEGYVFGTIAVRGSDGGFFTTGRGKHELNEYAFVKDVDHSNKIVKTYGPNKATLNAPLLAKIFANWRVKVIVHYHEQYEGLSTDEYAPPGTFRDAMRTDKKSFNIAGHGCFLLFDERGHMLL